MLVRCTAMCPLHRHVPAAPPGGHQMRLVCSAMPRRRELRRRVCADAGRGAPPPQPGGTTGGRGPALPPGGGEEGNGGRAEAEGEAGPGRRRGRGGERSGGGAVVGPGRRREKAIFVLHHNLIRVEWLPCCRTARESLARCHVSAVLLLAGTPTTQPASPCGTQLMNES